MDGSHGDALTITAVIPVYNGARYLAEALESVFAQSVPPDEVIVVDDGSADDSVPIAHSFGVRVIEQSNAGTQAARNAGIIAARSRWVAFLDQDDVWVPRKLERQRQALAACPEAVLGFCDFYRFDERGMRARSHLQIKERYFQAVERSTLSEHACACDYGSFALQFVRGRFFFPSALVARRDALIAVGLFDPTLRYWGDFDLDLRLLAHSKAPVVAVREPLMYYREHAANASRNVAELANDAVRVADAMLARPAAYLPAPAALHLRVVAQQLLRGGEPREAWKYVVGGLRLHPTAATLGIGAIALAAMAVGKGMRETAFALWDRYRAMRR